MSSRRFPRKGCADFLHPSEKETVEILLTGGNEALSRRLSESDGFCRVYSGPDACIILSTFFKRLENIKHSELEGIPFGAFQDGRAKSQSSITITATQLPPVHFFYFLFLRSSLFNAHLNFSEKKIKKGR